MSASIALADPFDVADYYTVSDDAEKLTATSIEEAIDEFLQSDGLHPDIPDSADCDSRPEALRAACDQLAPLTVTAYKRRIVDDDWITDVAGKLLERLAEQYADEFGADSSGLAAAEQQCDEMLLAVRAFVDRVKPWMCDDAGSRTYSADELWTLLCPYYGHERGVE